MLDLFVLRNRKEQAQKMTTLLSQECKDAIPPVKNKDVMIDRDYLWNVAYKLRIHTDVQDDRFTAAEHYFDNHDNEIAMIYSPKTYKEDIIVFDQPRSWPQEIKDMYDTTIIKKPKKINPIIPQREAPQMPIIAELQEDQTQTQQQQQLCERSNVNIQQRGRQMTTDKEMAAFWEKCLENFAHTKIYGHLKDVKNLTTIWDSYWINVLDIEVESIHNSTVLDYGAGGGHLGMHLHQQYGLKKYIAIDIAERSLKAAHSNIKHMNLRLAKQDLQGLEMGCKHANVDFGIFKADLFVAQNVIQHFPAINYLDEFLNNVNNSGIEIVVLHFRYSNETHIANDKYKDMSDVCFKCYTNEDYILDKMTKYAPAYIGDIHPLTDNQYVILKHIKLY